jgi:hypothetical protein
MRFRLGLVIGLAVGYYFGAKAGRTRYLQLREWIDKAKESGVLETATDKARAVVDLGVERAKDLIERTDDPVIDLSATGDYSPSR